jgi:hypothetical protein
VKKPITSQGFIDAALKRFRFSRMHLAIFKDRPLGVFAEFRMDRKVPDTTERKRDRKASAGRLRCRPRWRRSAKGIRAESRSMRSKGPAPNIEVEVQSPNSTRWELHLWRSESHSHVAWSERRSES